MTGSHPAERGGGSLSRKGGFSYFSICPEYLKGFSGWDGEFGMVRLVN